MLLTVQGIFVIGIPVGLFALLALLLFVPLRAHLVLRTTLYGGAGTLMLRFLALHHTLRFRIHALDEPPFTLELIRSDGRIRTVAWGDEGGRRQIDSVAILERVRFRELHAAWRIGIACSPACTAIASALVRRLTEAAAGYLLRGRKMDEVRIAVEPVYDANVCFFSFSGIATELPAQIIWEIFKQKRREKANASN